MKYIVDFDTAQNINQERAFAPAGVDKAKYIIEGISMHEKKVEIISPAGTRKKRGYIPAKKYNIDEKISIKLFSTFGTSNKVLKGVRHYLLLFKFFLYLLFTIRKNEKIVAYHMMKTAKLIYFLKKFKKFNLILQVEEIYSDVRKYSNNKVKNEYKVIECADAYIFPTKLLNNKLNVKNKPYVVVHGTYRVEETITEKFDDGKIHCVYAGTFDPLKGGAAAAISAAKHLDKKYHIHIIGFGKEDETAEVLKTIEETSKLSECIVAYDGLKRGEDYINFLQSCHIGLSTQNPEKDFNNTSFPSKVLSYMANGLSVVTVRIPAIETSAVCKNVYFYDKNTPEEIAKAIMKVDISNSDDVLKKIRELNEMFISDLGRLLGE